MIDIGMDPNIATIGGLVLSWHGLMTALAVVIAVYFAARLAKSHNLTADNVYSVAFWAVPGGIVGARLFPVLENLPYYTANPAKMFAVWEGGVSLYGAIIGGTIVGIVAARLQHISVPRLLDVSAPALILAQAIGRIGCTINGDAWGTPTSLPWGFVYTHPNAATTTILFDARHPAPVYEIFWDVLVLGMIWVYRKKPRPQGAIFLFYFSLYSVGRFAISWVRGEEAILGPFHQAHIISLISLAICVPLLLYMSFKKRPAGAETIAPTNAERPSAQKSEDPGASGDA
ncbi:MAG: prolipoprotein diacylglyceryl transferase [Dehalococcoidia bacterium]|nr:prolipoprotein diacylglyceryl transferase [Dehalococcoidia bacterium]